MAQAYRAIKVGKRRAPPGVVLLDGSYSMEEKITVEWEREITLDALAALLADFLAEQRSFAEIRTYLSGVLRNSDQTLPPGRISKYRVSARSLASALERLREAGRLSR